MLSRSREPKLTRYRAQAASSTLAELTEGTSFQPVLTEAVEDASSIKRVVFLSGKMYFDLVKERADRGLDGRITFVRIEVSLRLSLKLFKTQLTVLCAAGNLSLPLPPAEGGHQHSHLGNLLPLGAGGTGERRSLPLCSAPSTVDPFRRSQTRVRRTRGDGGAGAWCGVGFREQQEGGDGEGL